MDNMTEIILPHSFVQFRNIINQIESYWIPTIVIFGILGNMTSFLVFVFSDLRRMSWSVYLAALAASDSGFLVCLFVSWSNDIGIHLYHTNGWCQVFVYLTYVWSFLSVWYIVAFSIERYIVVCFPLRRPEVCSPKRAKIVVVSLAVFALGLYTFTIWTSGIQSQHGYAAFCSQTSNSKLVTIMTNIDTVITLLIPFLAILILNCLIIYTVTKYQTLRTGMMRGENSTMSASQGNNKSNILRSSQNIHKKKKINTSSSRSIVRMTKMLVIVSSTFLFLNLPSHAIRIYVFLLNNNFINVTDNDIHILITFRKIFQCIFYVNFTINFFLYSACGGTFRAALTASSEKMKQRIIRLCCKHWQHSDIGHTTVLSGDIYLRYMGVSAATSATEHSIIRCN